jgi:hypothetical protein
VLGARRARTRTERSATWVMIQPAAGGCRPEQAQRFWLAMAELLRRRRGGWRAHVVFELVWIGGRLRIGVWVPGVISPERVRRVTEIPWPGSVTRVLRDQEMPPPVPDGAVGGLVAVAGGRDWLPLRTDHGGTDPLHAVFGSGLYLAPADSVRVQVLARPVKGGRLARARAGAAGRAGGGSGAGRVLGGVGKVRHTGPGLLSAIADFC